MKTFILALLLIPSLLFGQEQESQPPETTRHEFDLRCLSPLEWSVTLVNARRNGVTVDVVIKRLAQDYATGPLQNYQPETIEYMLTIISAVFSADNVYGEEGMIAVFREVESLCISYIEAGEAAEESELST